MVVPDLNLLVYAFNASARHHDAAKAWWEELLNSEQAVGIPWIVHLGFLRLMTGRHVLLQPLPASDALELVEEWYEQPNVRLLPTGTSTRTLLAGLVASHGLCGGMITDAAIAAAALIHNAELHTNDTDFSRFPGLSVHNPLR